MIRMWGRSRKCLRVGGVNLFIYSSPALLLCLIKSSIEHQMWRKIFFRRIKVVKFYSYCFFLHFCCRCCRCTYFRPIKDAKQKKICANNSQEANFIVFVTQWNKNSIKFRIYFHPWEYSSGLGWLSYMTRMLIMTLKYS